MTTPTLTPAQISEFLAGGEWRRAFGGSVLQRGAKLARARQVGSVTGKILETGDAELCGQITEKSGASHDAIVALWLENGRLTCEADCSCDVGMNCEHGAALLEHLMQGERLLTAFGGTPHAERMTGGKTLGLPDEPPHAPPILPSEEPASRAGDSPKVRFLIRIERRPEGERISWMPDIYAIAYAVYGTHRVPLSPSGQLPPIVTPDGKIQRDRAEETMALRMLYAIDLLPGAEEPPASLRKLDRPPLPGTLWSVDKQQWPHPDIYWQRFRHEATRALESRGWEVQFSAHVGLKPLVFKTSSWSAEIVEEARGWFQLSAGFEIEGEKFDIQPILAALVSNRFLEMTEGMPQGQEFMIFLPDGRGLALPVGRFRHLLTTLGELMEYRFTGGPIRLSKLDAAQLASDEALSPEAPPEISELAVEVAEFQKIPRQPQPAGLAATLRDYQLDGYYWMQHLARHGLNGILADDMGLGKTLQTLTHLLAEIESERHQGSPSLVIAPTIVVENWQLEAAKFAPGLKVRVLQGPDRHRHFASLAKVDLALTSYALISRDLEQYLAQSFHLLILDEAQHIKNPGALVTRTVGQLRATHRLCLSGTPVENHLGELWSLMHFLMPGMLGSQEAFTETYRTPIEKNGNAAKREALAHRVGPLILRRTKQDVAKELPPKTEILHAIQLSEAQKDLYETVRSAMDKQVRQALAMQGVESRIVFLDALLKLRQICCHPSLLDRQPDGAESAKFEYLADMLETLGEEGHRVLLFSQFTSMLSLIEDHLTRQEVPYLKLTGETKNRQELVERWQGGEGSVFLISLKAGGTGLTRTGADTVIHYDPWWNPAAENQATDRAYRIGQDKPVFVHKLICQGTVEERIQQMQARKDHLATDLLSGATQTLSLTPALMESLLAPAEGPK
ncbi:MAG: DEAD/DEAH box helicase [Verrucomicrobiales bacterium]